MRGFYVDYIYQVNHIKLVLYAIFRLNSFKMTNFLAPSCVKSYLLTCFISIKIGFVINKLICVFRPN